MLKISDDLRCPIFIGDFEFLHFICKLQTTCGKRDIYLFIQTTRYFMLTIEAVRDDHYRYGLETNLSLKLKVLFSF